MLLRISKGRWIVDRHKAGAFIRRRVAAMVSSGYLAEGVNVGRFTEHRVIGGEAEYQAGNATTRVSA